MSNSRYKLFELIIIFILIPISYAFNYNPLLKATIGILGFIYIIYILLKVEKVKLHIKKVANYKIFWREIAFKFLIIAIVTTLLIWFTDNKNLFYIVINKPKIWIFILFFYSLFSVYPQELIYRTFFFKRYKSLFKTNLFFILTNALLFSLAHLFFKNGVVLYITFIGGILFAITYKKTKSTFLVTIEHAIYGCWLFTVGMGNILGFPS